MRGRRAFQERDWDEEERFRLLEVRDELGW